MKKKTNMEDMNIDNVKIIINDDLNEDLNRLNKIIAEKFTCKITIDAKNKLVVGEGKPFEMIISSIALILTLINVGINLSKEDKKVILSLIFKVIDGVK